MSCDGPALTALCSLADAVRADTVGDSVTYVVNRNLNFTNVCYTGCRFCAFAQRESDEDSFTLSLAQVGDRVDEAAAAGATEICMQGGIHPDLPGTAYFDLAAEVKRRQPDLHLHAFSPMEVINGAARSQLTISEWLSRAQQAGVDSLPGTAAEILDDEVRWVLTKGKLPAAEWIEVITTAHSLGIPTSATMMYGHVDRPDHWVAHLRNSRYSGAHRRIYRICAVALRPSAITHLFGRGCSAWPDGSGKPGSPRYVAADAARCHRQHSMLLGQTGSHWMRRHAPRRCQRPGWNAHGRDHFSDGRFRSWQCDDCCRVGRHRHGDRAPRPTADHQLSPGGHVGGSLSWFRGLVR